MSRYLSYLRRRCLALKTTLGTLRLLYFSKRPDVVLSFHGGIGDDLLMSCLCEALSKQHRKRVWLLSRYPDLFSNNPYIRKVIMLSNKHRAFPEHVAKYFEKVNLQITHLSYACHNVEEDKDYLPDRHIIEVLFDKLLLKYHSSAVPKIYLSNIENQFGKFNKKQICIHSSGQSSESYMKNKDWIFERFSEIVDYLVTKGYEVIQIGSAGDPKLHRVRDLRGKTSIRQTASVLINSYAFIGNVGFLMHLAKAVNLKSIIVYGGRELPFQSGYLENINLFYRPSCSPCGYRNRCDRGNECMEKISVATVKNAIEQIGL